MRYWRYIWALPATMLGLLLASLALVGGRVRLVAGAVEAHGPWLRWALSSCVPLRGGAAAITLGHVVVGQDEDALTMTREHERVHVRQYERWGLLFLPAYGIASIRAMWSGGHYYFDNAFEREAFAQAWLRSLPCAWPAATATFEGQSSLHDDDRRVSQRTGAGADNAGLDLDVVDS